MNLRIMGFISIQKGNSLSTQVARSAGDAPLANPRAMFARLNSTNEET